MTPAPTRARPQRVQPRAEASRAALSAAQEQIWFLDRLAPGQTTYNLVRAFRLTGPLDRAALTRALADLVQRHETLRTVLRLVDGAPAQIIRDRVDGYLTYEDLGDRPDAEREARERVDRDARSPFDLENGPLLRCQLLRLTDTDHVFSLVTHHVASDGRSMIVFFEELSTLYNAHSAGRTPELPPLPVQFGDFAEWQQSQLRDGTLDRHLSYFTERLRDVPTLAMPSDRRRPSRATFRSAAMVRSAPPDVWAAVQALAARENATVLMVLTAAYVTVLARHSQQDDITIGTAAAGRGAPELNGVIGPFMNMLGLRVDAGGEPTFAELLGRVKTALLEAWAHRTAPLERVVTALQLERDPSRNPLFQFCIQLLDHTTSDTTPIFHGLTPERLYVDLASHPFDFSINAIAVPGGLDYRVEYSTDLFDRPRVERMIGHLESVLVAGAADPDVTIAALPLLSAEEREQLLAFGRGADVPQPAEPVHVQIAAVAAAMPDAVAARMNGADLTYAELDRRADLLARRLRRLGVGHGDVVGISLLRGFDHLIAKLGTLKAGGAFVMMDPEHPPQRQAFILSDTAAKVVLTHSALHERLPAPHGWVALCLDTEWPDIEAAAEPPLVDETDEDSLAYVLYTSGSTGKPKGVMIEHHALTTFTIWMGGLFGFGPGTRVGQYMSLIFDFSIGEIFSALTRGAALVFVAEEERLDPDAFADFLERERITHLNGPPAVLLALPPREYPDLTGMICGGEAVPPELVNRWNVPPRRFVDGYGPTEAAIGCIFHECEYRFWTSQPPIGRSMPRRYTHILDRWDNLCPIGVPGEVVVGGAGLARGYLNLPELTAQKFIADPVIPGGRIYRTGDLGLWNEKGQVEFLGRIDTQVKLNGLRIELEEIEAALAGHPRVGAVTVILREDTPGNKRLVGYVVPANGAVDPGELRNHLTDLLPRYMIPNVFVTLDALPLTSVGKVDRAALPAPSAEPATADRVRREPSTPTEQTVAATLAAILQLERVAADDNFFALGGTSLQAARAVLDLRERFGIGVAVGDFYAAPDVGYVAATIDKAIAERQAQAAAEQQELANDIAELERRLAAARAELARKNATEGGQ